MSACLPARRQAIPTAWWVCVVVAMLTASTSSSTAPSSPWAGTPSSRPTAAARSGSVSTTPTSSQWGSAAYFWA